MQLCVASPLQHQFPNSTAASCEASAPALAVARELVAEPRLQVRALQQNGIPFRYSWKSQLGSNILPAAMAVVQEIMAEAHFRVLALRQWRYALKAELQDLSSSLGVRSTSHSPAPLAVAQELVAKARPRVRPLQQARDVGPHAGPEVHLHHSQVGRQRGEGVVCNFWPRRACLKKNPLRQ